MQKEMSNIFYRINPGQYALLREPEKPHQRELKPNYNDVGEVVAVMQG
jgi:hypothetical protein